MSGRWVSMAFGMTMMAYGGILLVPVTGPLLASTLGLVFLATGVIQLVVGFFASGEVTCPHCQKKSEVRARLWSATPRLSSRE